MLFSILFSLTQPSAACMEMMSVDSVFPAAGTMSVPVDSHFFLKMRCQSILEAPRFILEQDGEPVEIDVTIHQRDVSVDAQVMMVEIEPVEALEPDAMLLLSIDQFGMQNKLATFVTDDFESSVVTEEVPQIWWMESYEVYQEDVEFSECSGTLENELYLDVSSPDAEDTMIRIYEVDPDLRTQEIFSDMLQTPFHEIHDPADYEQRMIYIPAEKANQSDICFTATYVNAAGEESAPAPVQCLTDFDYMDEFYCGTGMGMMGCSSMPVSELGWMALFMGSVGFVRRRR